VRGSIPLPSVFFSHIITTITTSEIYVNELEEVAKLLPLQIRDSSQLAGKTIVKISIYFGDWVFVFSDGSYAILVCETTEDTADIGLLTTQASLYHLRSAQLISDDVYRREHARQAQAREDEHQKRAEERDRSEYLRLKAKFEGLNYEGLTK